MELLLTIMAATRKHKVLVQKIKHLYEGKGFYCETEKLIKPLCGGKYLVDIFCQKTNQTVIIECGNVEWLRRLSELKKSFPESKIFHYPYLSTRNLGWSFNAKNKN